MENVEIPQLKDVCIYIVHYDEQFPSEVPPHVIGCQNETTYSVEEKDPETIKQFLISNLDPSKPIFIVTDFGTSYPKVLKEVFGDNLLHQYCLLHLNKLIVNDFPKKTTIAQELVKYRLLNIFYNRQKEIEMLRKLFLEERVIIQKEEIMD